jgi:hypothetical protein
MEDKSLNEAMAKMDKTLVSQGRMNKVRTGRAS